ncbi:MAG: hypothetical protein GY855_01790, partial [candidate division Zixibacteria bacterium]|nr:hypothetical protein [candidate division Zixibacteria bacterium]
MLNIILSIVFALSGATLLFFSGIILRENPRGRINRITALMLFFAGIAPVLATVYYALIIPSGKELPVWLFNLFFTWELFFPSLVMFSVVFPAEHIYYKSHRRLFFAAFIPHIAHIVMVTGFSDPNAILSAISFESDFPILGILFEYIGYFLKLIVVLFGLALEVHNRFFSIVNLTYLLASTFFLYQGYKTVINPRIKQQVRIIIYGITTAVGLYAFAYIIPSIFAIRILPQLQYLMIIIGLLVGPGLIAWAILKYRFLDIRLIVRQSLVYSLSSVVVIGGYLIIINSLGNFLRNVFGAGFAVLEVAVILLALLFFQPVLNFLDSLLRRLFIKGGTDFRDVLERFSSTIITLFDFDKLVSEILKTFKDDLLIENVFLCLPGEKGQCKIIPADTEKSFFVRKDRVLESFLIVKELPVPAVDVPVPALAQASRDLFKDKETRILIPLISSHRLLGYIGIGEKTSGLGYNTEDIMTFKVLANQTVVAINNARLYKESMENQRREEELAIARQIQRQLLPKQMPSS